MKNIKIELKWALIFVVMMLLWMVMEKAVGLYGLHIEQHAVVTNFVAIPAILIYVLALLDKRRNYYGGTMSYKQGFLSGLFITLIVTVISPLTQYITNTVIAPEYFTAMIKHTVNNDIMTLEEARANFNMKSYIIQSLIATPVMGLVTTAIVAGFTKTNPE